jgi:ATP phosphoribosyltransferase regulatory subunit HisZ
MTRETESAKDGNALSSQISALKDAVDEAQSSQDRFLRSFSDKQKSGLKDFTKKLEKADSAVLKALKTLDENSGRPNNSKQIASSADKLEQALTSFQSEQHKLAEEMGIASTPNKTAAN